jgi:hypothetical protein
MSKMTNNFDLRFEFWSFLPAAGKGDYFEFGAFLNFETLLKKK